MYNSAGIPVGVVNDDERGDLDEYDQQSRELLLLLTVSQLYLSLLISFVLLGNHTFNTNCELFWCNLLLWAIKLMSRKTLCIIMQSYTQQNLGFRKPLTTHSHSNIFPEKLSYDHCRDSILCECILLNIHEKGPGGELNSGPRPP